MSDHVTVWEKWTRTAGWRKIGDGPWEPIDLSALGGKVPILFYKDEIEWVQTEERRGSGQ